MLKPFHLVSSLGLTITLFACGGSDGTRPHDMSAANHTASAEEEEQQAQVHQEKFEPSAREEQPVCNGASDAYGMAICWTDYVNPTTEHLEHAEQHRKLAEKHRAANAALRDAERISCKGISEDDRIFSPFSHQFDIRSVSKLTEEAAPFHSSNTDLAGATVAVNAVPGLTKEWLERIVDCHLARNASLGHKSPEMPYCPLVPAHITVSVRSVQGGFAVDIYGKTDDAKEEVWQRAQLIKTVP